MNETPLTTEQKAFAGKYHNLIYSFLNKKNLREDDFYDIVAFGFLQSVRRYFEEPDLSKKYAFTTIAWGGMKTSLSNYYKKESSQKRKAHTISLEAEIYGDGEILSLQEIVSVPDSSMMDFETELLMLELASKVSKREMDIIRMKADGYGVREIAKVKKMPMKGVTELLAGLRDTVLAVCYK
jgi:RNA polymerase sigma factor (sigma-70 family)